MRRSRILVLAAVVLNFGFAAQLRAHDPVAVDPRLKVELYAENPQLVTPTGIDVDATGRVWVIESNTHFPPEEYQGHPSDRILVLQGRNTQGRAESISVFQDGLKHTMSLAVKPAWLDAGPGVAASTSSNGQRPLELYLATRREIYLCTDTDGDLKSDQMKKLVYLETAGDYPHNGLAGFAFDGLGWMYFGFGENLGADYKIIGIDGVTYTGGGEGGNIYRCRPDGTRLERWATGFWNPHASCYDAFGHMFSVDNDPDSRPPCRLLQIVQGGDYGYRFRNGRKGTHPFTSWNGEIAGTLPMVSGTGEAPSGIIAYESNGLPSDYLGNLLVGSWGDHRIDRFVLKPQGLSYTAIPQPIITGDENFRPVGLATAPDGSIYFTDWVSKEYKLHSLGRVWRLSAAKPPTSDQPAAKSLLPNDQHLSVNTMTIAGRRLLARKLSETHPGRENLKQILNNLEAPVRDRLECLWALASVPVLVEKLNLFQINQGPAPFLTAGDEVSIAAAELFGTPQLTPPFPVPDDFFVPEMAILNESGSRWSRAILVNLLGYLLPTRACASMGFTADSADPFLNSLIRRNVARNLPPDAVSYSCLKDVREPSPNDALIFFLAARDQNPQNEAVAQHGLKSADMRIRRAAVQWIGEERLSKLRPDVEALLASEPMTDDLFLCCLASLSLLEGVPPSEFEKTPPAQQVLPIVKDSKRSSSIRAMALRMLPSNLPELDGKTLRELTESPDRSLQLEAVRTLQFSKVPEREELLVGMARNTALEPGVRADAVAALAGAVDHAPPTDACVGLLTDLAVHEQNASIRLEAVRCLSRLVPQQSADQPADPRVSQTLNQLSTDAAQEKSPLAKLILDAVQSATKRRDSIPPQQLLAHVLATPTVDTTTESVDAGRRVFYRAHGAGCFKCHTVGGRGGHVGPDLTVISRTMDRKKLAESILEPSREISPQFTSWVIETKSGKVFTGILLGEEVNGDLRLGNQAGETFFVPFREIETRTPSKTSIMPERLHELMSPGELLDLLTFLQSLK